MQAHLRNKGERRLRCHMHHRAERRPRSALGGTHRTAHRSWVRRCIVNDGRLDGPFIAEKPAQHRGEKRRTRAHFAKFVGLRNQASVQTDGQGRRAQDTDDLAPLRRIRRFQQSDDIGDALSRLHAARLQQRLGALVHVNGEAHELRNDKPAKQHQHQATEQRAGY